MSVTPELIQQASDPATAGHVLADLAAAHPELRATIALNPSTYEGLLEWLAQYGAADVQSALAARRGGTPVSAPPPPPAVVAHHPTQWSEPSRSIPVTWLNHDLRYTLALVAVGVAALLHMVWPAILSPLAEAIYRSTNDYRMAENSVAALRFLLATLPLVAMTAAVILLPSQRRNTRIAVILAGAPIVLLLLQLITANGAYVLSAILGYVGLLVPTAALAAWMVARMRPAASFAVLPAALVSILLTLFGARIFGFSFWHPISLLIELLSIGVLVGIAWLARLIAKRTALGPTPAERAAAFEASQHAARVAHVQQWESAYAAAHGGQAPPPGTVVPPMTVAPAYGGGGTNMMAVLALVFGIGGGLLGIVFGHIALGQIRRTGEQGRGLALAGLICGYVGGGILLIVIIVSLVVTATARSYYF